MSEHIAFFGAAGDKAAAKVRTRGPSGDTVTGAWFDADDAVAAWTGFLTGHAGEPREVAPLVNDGSAVFELPEQLLGELCDATAGALRSTAEVWHTDLLQDGDVTEAEAGRIVAEVAALARRNRAAGLGTYLWVTC